MFWQMCLNQQCVDVSSVDTADCGDCSMQGVSHFVILYTVSQLKFGQYKSVELYCIVQYNSMEHYITLTTLIYGRPM